MRIKAVHVAGLAVALVGGTASKALADAPVKTNGADVTVAAATTITTTSGPAVEVNSNNNVINNGSLTSVDSNGTQGILLDNGFTGNITSNTIALTESYKATDNDNDGDLDGPWAMGSSRYGILLNSGAMFTGSVNSTGSITIEGNNSGGVVLNALLNGALSVTGAISVTGDNSSGVLIGATGGVQGDVNINSAMVVRGQNSTGIEVDGQITGGLNINGAISTSGYRVTTRPSDPTTIDPDDNLQGGSTLAIHANVTGGVTLQGIGAQTDSDSDADDATVSLVQFGGAPAIVVQAAGSNISLGPNSLGFGLDVRGSVSTNGVDNGIATQAIEIIGNGGFTSTVQNGVSLDNALSSTAYEANAYGVYVGNGGITPQIRQRGSFTVSSISVGAFNAYGLYFDHGANVASFTNTGTLYTQVLGATGNATAITDLTGNLTSITNTGTLIARVLSSSPDPANNVPPPPVTGFSTAIDVSNQDVVHGVTFTQGPPAPFVPDDSDSDGVQGVVPAVETIGDIKFGAGDDTVNLLAGTIAGNISFGDGNNAMTVNNGASFTGQMSTSGVQHLVLDVVNGLVSLTGGGATNLTSATFESNLAQTQFGTLKLLVGSSSINASGTIVFQPGSHLELVAPSGLSADTGAVTILSAAGGVTFSTGNVTVDNAPFVYDLTLTPAPTSVTARLVLKTPAELGLSGNQTAAFLPIVNALRTDTKAADAFTALTNASQFNSAYGQLMPSYASASTELAATAIQQEQSATTNRLSTTRLSDLNEVSAWAQEIGYVINRDPVTANGDRYRGHGFGMAVGIDGPLNNGALFGLSASFLTSDAEEPVRPDGGVSSSFFQGNAYLGSAFGPIDLDFVGGLGAGMMRGRRVVQFGDFSGEATGKWWSYEGHGAIRASAPMRASNWLVITPEASLTYVGLQEQGYTEQGGGTALDMKANASFSQRLWADAGIEFSSRFNFGRTTVLAPRLYLGYRGNAIDNPATRRYQFISTGDTFSLTDDKVGSGGPLIGLGLDATNGYSTFSLSYEGEFANQIDRHSLNIAVRYRF